MLPLITVIHAYYSLHQSFFLHMPQPGQWSHTNSQIRICALYKQIKFRYMTPVGRSRSYEVPTTRITLPKGKKMCEDVYCSQRSGSDESSSASTCVGLNFNLELSERGDKFGLIVGFPSEPDLIGVAWLFQLFSQMMIRKRMEQEPNKNSA